jgi:hypothetical protein
MSDPDYGSVKLTSSVPESYSEEESYDQGSSYVSQPQYVGCNNCPGGLAPLAVTVDLPNCYPDFFPPNTPAVPAGSYLVDQYFNLNNECFWEITWASTYNGGPVTVTLRVAILVITDIFGTVVGYKWVVTLNIPSMTLQWVSAQFTDCQLGDNVSVTGSNPAGWTSPPSAQASISGEY